VGLITATRWDALPLLLAGSALAVPQPAIQGRVQITFLTPRVGPGGVGVLRASVSPSGVRCGARL